MSNSLLLFICDEDVADAAAAAATAAAAEELDVCVFCCAVFNAFDLLRTAPEYSELFRVASTSVFDDNDCRRSSVISSTILLLLPAKPFRNVLIKMKIYL